MLQKIPYDLSGLVGSTARNFWVLQREYNWQVIMPHDMRGWIGVMVSQFCQGITFGDYSFERTSQLRYGADKRHYAGLRTIDAAKLDFIVTGDSSVISYFEEWHKLIVDGHFYHPKADYAKDIFVMMYDVSGIETYMYRLKGCFPRNKPELGLSYSKEGVLQVSIQFSVDKVELTSIAGGLINRVATSVLGKLFSRGSK